MNDESGQNPRRQMTIGGELKDERNERKHRTARQLYRRRTYGTASEVVEVEDDVLKQTGRRSRLSAGWLATRRWLGVIIQQLVRQFALLYICILYNETTHRRLQHDMWSYNKNTLFCFIAVRSKPYDEIQLFCKFVASRLARWQTVNDVLNKLAVLLKGHRAMLQSSLCDSLSLWECEEASVGYISAADSGSIDFIQIFLVGSERCKFCTIDCVIFVQGHPRSLILLAINNAYAAVY